MVKLKCFMLALGGLDATAAAQQKQHGLTGGFVCEPLQSFSHVVTSRLAQTSNYLTTR